MSSKIYTHDIPMHATRVEGTDWHGLATVDPALSTTSNPFAVHEVTALDIVASHNGAILPPSSLVSQLDGDETEEEGKTAINTSLRMAAYNIGTPEKALYLPVSKPFGDSYTLLTNAEFLRIVRECLGAAGMPDELEYTGTIKNRQVSFVSASLPAADMEAGGRKFRGFLNFVNSFNGDHAFLAQTSSTCIVCNNTLQMALKEGAAIVKHTKNMELSLARIPNLIEEALTVHREFSQDFLMLHNHAITMGDAEAFLASFLAGQKAEKIATVSFNRVAEIHALFVRGKGNAGQTRADLFSGITEYFTHYANANKSEVAKLASSEFGSGAERKRDAIRALVKDETVAEAIEKGRKLLVDYASR